MLFMTNAEDIVTTPTHYFFTVTEEALPTLLPTPAFRNPVCTLTSFFLVDFSPFPPCRGPEPFTPPACPFPPCRGPEPFPPPASLSATLSDHCKAMATGVASGQGMVLSLAQWMRAWRQVKARHCHLHSGCKHLTNVECSPAPFQHERRATASIPSR